MIITLTIMRMVLGTVYVFQVLYTIALRPMNLGRITTTEPLKSLDDVKTRSALYYRTTLQRILHSSASVSNSALRASDILQLKRSDLKGTNLFIREKKTRKLRRITLNDCNRPVWAVWITPQFSVRGAVARPGSRVAVHRSG